MYDHHVRWIVINGEHLYVDHIYYMIHVRPLGFQCSEAMSVHARLVKFNSSIPHVQSYLAPTVCEHEPITADHHMVSQHEELSQRCILRENTFILKFSEGIIL